MIFQSLFASTLNEIKKAQLNITILAHALAENETNISNHINLLDGELNRLEERQLKALICLNENLSDLITLLFSEIEVLDELASQMGVTELK